MIGLSGGVDSAVSAALLKRAGAQVLGAFIKTWTPPASLNLPAGKAGLRGASCAWRNERRDAMRVAAHLDIPFVTIDLEKEYKESVVDYMISEYKSGRTPNPDVMCNKEIKFGAFLRKALEMGADAIATGHYAQIIPPSPSLMLREGRGEIQLLRGVDPAKDQSYFLWTLTQDQLSKNIFPVGHLLKSEVRELARQLRLPVASKKDSQGICFLGDVDMKEFLSHYIKTKPGKVFEAGARTKVIGEHEGALFYTLGEKILGQYVVGKDVEKNLLIVTKNHLTPTLPYNKGGQRRDIKLKDINWISGSQPNTYDLVPSTCQVRYHGEKLPCTVSGNTVTFKQPVLVAPGQSIVFYDSNICLGGGVVE